MVGSFRFVLAWLVMLSHMPYSPFALNFNLAVSAVILFYFISGYLMYKSFFKEEIKDISFIKKTLFFYTKRVLRLFPLYLIVLFLTVLSIYFLGKSEFIALLNQDLSIKKILLNSLLIFNNYVFAPFEIHSLLPHPLIPPTWSLSTEWHFYLLVPILFLFLRKERKIFYIIMIASLIFELNAFSYVGGVFNSDVFGYRYIFGVLWIFMLGFYVSKNGFDKFIKSIYVFVVVYFLIYGFTFSAHPYVREIFLAIFITPFIPGLFKIDFKYDKLLGSFSYPVFLSHFLSFYLIEKAGIKPGELYFFSVFCLVLFISFVLSIIQKKIDNIRMKF